MRTIAAVITAVVIFSANAAAQDYAPVVASLNKSVLRVAIQKGGQTGTCTAVVYEIVDGRAFAFTAAHCVASTPGEAIDITVDDRDARAHAFNRILDLAIVSFRPQGETANIVLADKTPPAGSPVIIAGYAFGVEDIVYQFGHVARPLNRETKQLWINGDLIFGDSGGGILDAQGRLIGITSAIYSQGPAHIGGAVRIEQVRDFLDEFRDQQKKEKK